MIILLATLDSKTQAGLEVISFSMYLLTIISTLAFINTHRHNEKERQTQIYVFSTQLFPMLRFEAVTGKLFFALAAM